MRAKYSVCLTDILDEKQTLLHNVLSQYSEFLAKILISVFFASYQNENKNIEKIHKGKPLSRLKMTISEATKVSSGILFVE